ncbi:Copper transport protein [Aphelenchoides bicaudatus]|nr:Copper transport protein [Aphelenchoides bicaudatus]
MAHNHMDHDMGGHGMAFNFNSEKTILFSFWHTTSAFGIVISCFVILIGCVLLESIRWFRVHRNFTQTASNLAAQTNGRRPVDTYLITDTLLHGLQLFLVYCAMLVFMTFNVWLCATIIIGEVGTHLAFRIFLPHLDNALTSTSAQPCCG